MNRSIITLVALAALLVVVPATAFADDPAPTPAQIEKAKKAFQEGKKLHEQKKLPEAIEKFKESYNLSKNPLLLYNIGLTMEEATMEDLALFYYRKFLTDAPADAAQRPQVEERVKVLSAKFNPGGEAKPPENTNPTDTQPKPVVETGPRKPVEIKPPGTYTAADFQHEIVDVAPPAKPLDVTAFVPEDSGFVVTLYYRTTGEGKFSEKEMRWRYKELVARIPAPKMIGNSVQYYIEAKDTTGAVITRSGKAISPHLITLEAGAPQRFYPDFTEEGEAKVTEADIKARDEEDDPLNKGKKQTAQATQDDPIAGPTEEPAGPGNGFRDVGSTKFKYTKWGTTIGAAAFIGIGVYSFILAGRYASDLEDWSKQCASPPCNPFDQTSADNESAGKRYQTISNVTLGLGIATAAVAGYFWYKELTAKKRGELKVGKANDAKATSWVMVPSVGGDGQTTFVGGTAVTRF